MTVELIRPADALAGKTVLLRANLDRGVTRELGDAIASFAGRGARVGVLAGFGEPRGEANPAFSLAPFRQTLEQASRTRVTFVPYSVGPIAEAGLDRVPFGETALLENLRFHADERRNSRAFAFRLSVLGDFFAVSGPVPSLPIGWLTELAKILPAPDAVPTATASNEV